VCKQWAAREDFFASKIFFASPREEFRARAFQQFAHEISTCGNRLRMNFLNEAKGRKISGKREEKFFKKNS